MEAGGQPPHLPGQQVAVGQGSLLRIKLSLGTCLCQLLQPQPNANAILCASVAWQPLQSLHRNC